MQVKVTLEYVLVDLPTAAAATWQAMHDSSSVTLIQSHVRLNDTGFVLQTPAKPGNLKCSTIPVR